MVLIKQLENNSHFLKSVKEAKSISEIKKLLMAAGHSCLRVLVAIIKACVFKEIPLSLTGEQTKKLKSYKNKLRAVAQLSSKKTR